MKRYQLFSFTIKEEGQSEIVSALLSTMDHIGLEETGGQLLVYFNDDLSVEEAINEIAVRTGTAVSRSLLDDRNWNQLWESNFEPVEVDDFVSVRADFHAPATGVEHEIRITPKMSFGTGHHATTWSMMSQMRQVAFDNRSVFDFGTGTGILAILAEKLGAASVLAVDNDPWCMENAAENAQRNHCTRIRLVLADDATGVEKFDVILANINRNVILDNMQVLRQRLNTGGTILFSGLLLEDEGVIVEAAREAGLGLLQKAARNNWLCLSMSSL